jgi:hypothetical protein
MMPQKEFRHKPRIKRDGHGATSPRRTGARNLSMQPLKLDAEDRRVYETWRRNIILLWAFIVGMMVILCTVLAWRQW